MTGVMFGIATAGTILCNKARGPKLLFSIALIYIPISVLFAHKIKEERVKAFNFFEKHFEEHMEWFPITRRAFNRALEVKNKQIKELEEELQVKEMKLQEKLSKSAVMPKI